MAVTEDEVSGIDFTPRMEAIAQGNDPDEIGGSEGEIQQDVEDLGTDAAPSPEPEVPEKWYGDSDREIASTYGMEDADLEQFQSAEDFKGFAARLETLSRNRASRQTAAPTDPPAEPPAGEVDEEVKFERMDRDKYVKEGYDEHTVALVDAYNKQQDILEKQHKQLQEIQPAFQSVLQQQQQYAAQQFANQFHLTTDNLSEERYGRATKEDGSGVQLAKAHDDNRRKLFEATERVIDLLQKNNSPIPSLQAVIERAELMAFGDEILTQRVTDHQKRVADQARRVRPGGGKKVAKYVPPPSDEGDNDEASRIANDPDIKRFVQS
jgi:hypothetical protein